MFACFREKIRFFVNAWTCEQIHFFIRLPVLIRRLAEADLETFRTLLQLTKSTVKFDLQDCFYEINFNSFRDKPHDVCLQVTFVIY